MYSSLPCKLYYGVRTQLMYHNIEILQQNILKEKTRKKNKRKKKKKSPRISNIRQLKHLLGAINK